MTDLEAVTVKNLLEDWLPHQHLAAACARLSRASTTHSFVPVLAADGLLVVLVRARA